MHVAAIFSRHIHFYSMRRATRTLLGGLAVALFLSALVFGSYFLLREAEVTVPSLFKPAPGTRLLIRMEGFQFARSENGRVAWTMSARSADLYESKEAQLKDVEIEFSSPDGKRAALIGELARMDTGSGDGSIRRGAREVRIVTSDGYLMTTDSLVWKAAERVVKTQDPFKVLGKEIYVEGTGLAADVDMRKLTVSSNVKAVLQE
jgi:LPS export ABC transporter protein LptC